MASHAFIWLLVIIGVHLFLCHEQATAIEKLNLFKNINKTKSVK